ncbi:MAG TPA: MFS transporter [Desulfobacteraceae bacterium]|nr:MFS transporter [Desulfobacteraceae bacterium]
MQTAKNTRFAFVLLFLLYMFDYIDRMVIVSLFPFLKQDWQLSDTECGLLVSAVYWSILLFSFPVSILIDRWSRTKTIGLMSVLWSLATLACVFTKNFRQLFTARIAIGVGEAGYAPGGTALISALYPPEKRARMLGIWNASIPLGSAIGIALGGIIAEHFGWRHAFGIVALPGLIFALLFFWVRDYKTIRLDTPESETPAGTIGLGSKAVHTAGSLLKPSLIFNNLAFTANVFVTTAMLSWLPTYFHRLDDIPMSQAGPKAGLIMFMAIVGAPLGGYLSDRWTTRTKQARMLFPAISSAVSALILFLAFTYLTGSLQYVALLLAGVTLIMFVPPGVAVTQDVVHPGIRATSLSVNIVIQHTLGSPLGPLFVGAMSDRHGLTSALGMLPVFTLIAGILFLVGSFYYAKDTASVEVVAIEME